MTHPFKKVFFVLSFEKRFFQRAGVYQLHKFDERENPSDTVDRKISKLFEHEERLSE